MGDVSTLESFRFEVNPVETWKLVRKNRMDLLTVGGVGVTV